MKKIKTITICSSAAFYRQVLDIEKQLKKKGFKVLIPKTANIMKRNNDFDVSHYKTWYNNAADYKKKTELMMAHFRKVAVADTILVVNLEKNGSHGYIGGNALMEMSLALWLKKKIYLWEEPDENSPFIEEILGMNPTILNHNVELLQ